jgi:2,4-diaminopentanoate dehydrogenase
MKQPMKVLVWGPGGLGTVCIREISMLKEFELVGVYAYSAAKHGVDAGTLVGLPPLGIKASNNAAEMLAVDCDVVLYTARDLATFNNDDEILRLLAAGKNLVTALPYHYMHVTRPPEYVAKVEAACKQGSSVFHATGVNPDLVGERLLLALTGLCNDVRHVKMQENWDVATVSRPKSRAKAQWCWQSPAISSSRASWPGLKRWASLTSE